MSGIIALFGGHARDSAEAALEKLDRRGPAGRNLAKTEDGLLGHARLSPGEPAQPAIDPSGRAGIVLTGSVHPGKSAAMLGPEALLRLFQDGGPDAAAKLEGTFALVFMNGGQFLAARDLLGEKPLYLMRDGKQTWFASEIKPLHDLGNGEIEPVLPGHVYEPESGHRRFRDLEADSPGLSDLEEIRRQLKDMLERTVERHLAAQESMGAFLSGGLDSSVTAAVASRFRPGIDTFSVGLPGAPDLANAREAARHLKTTHHEFEIKECDVLEHLPEIIRRLESFDRDLVRSSIPCYFASRLASRHVRGVITGEGPDELFGGYSHEWSYRSPQKLHTEIIRLLNGLHWLGLQRGDRMTAAHSLDVRLPFLDMDLVRLALSIDAGMKLVTPERMEKWLLRTTFEELIPSQIAWRTKAQFDQGSGVADLMPRLAAGKVNSEKIREYSKECGELAPRDEEEAWYYAHFRRDFNVARLRKALGRWETPPESDSA